MHLSFYSSYFISHHLCNNSLIFILINNNKERNFFFPIHIYKKNSFTTQCFYYISVLWIFFHTSILTPMPKNEWNYRNKYYKMNGV